MHGVHVFLHPEVISWDHATVHDLHVHLRLVSLVHRDFRDFPYNVHSTENLAEDNMSAVQPWGGLECDVELGGVHVFTSVSHGHCTSAIMLQFEVLISEYMTVNTSTSGSVVCCDVTTLNHEPWDNSVEFGLFVLEKCAVCFVKSFCNLYEILGSKWNLLSKDSNLNTSDLLSADGNFEENLICDLGHSRLVWPLSDLLMSASVQGGTANVDLLWHLLEVHGLLLLAGLMGHVDLELGLHPEGHGGQSQPNSCQHHCERHSLTHF